MRNFTGSAIILPFLLFLSVFSYAQTPTANFSTSAVSGCSPMVVRFQDQSTGNVSSWFWDFGNGATSTLKDPSTTYFTPGSYTIKLTVTNASGSHSVTRTNLITVWNNPVVNFRVNDSTACFPHRAQFTDLSSSGTGGTITNWIWDFGNGTQSTQRNPLNVYTNSGNFSVTLKVTNDKGCFSALTKPAYIKLTGGVIAGFTNTTPAVCKPPFNISFTNTSTGPGTLTYSWNFGDGTSSTQRSPSHTYTASGNYAVTMSVTSSLGCSDTIRKDTALALQNINTSFTAPDSICVNSTINFSNSSTPSPASSLWNFGDGTTSTLKNPSKTFNTVGTYVIRLSNTYSYCSDSAIRTVKVLPRPVANFTSSATTKCQPDLTVNFQDASANAVRWQWNFGDGSTSTQQNPNHTYRNYGTFNVQLVVTNSSGCTDTIIKNGLVRIIRPVININGIPVRGCIPYTISPSANIVTLDAVTSYLWDFGDGSTSTLPNPVHTYPNQGTYTVKLTITTSTGCTETAVLTDAVRVGRRPVINFAAAPPVVCAFEPIQFTDLTNEADEWIWYFGDGVTSVDKNPIHTYSDTGTFSVKLIATNNGCQDSLTIQNMVRAKPPIAKFGYLTDCSNKLKFSFLDSSIGATTWFWNFGDGTTSTEQNPVHFYNTFNNYTVSLTVTNDTCSHTITKIVRVFNEFPDITVNEDTICRNNTVHFYAVSGSLANIESYLWDFGDNSPQWNSAVTGSGNYAYHYYSVAGAYNITLITTDIYGCKDTIFRPAFIHAFGPTIDLAAANINGCKGLTATFTDRSRSDGFNNIVQWNWDFGDGSSTTRIAGGSVRHTYDSIGNYTVKFKIKDAYGCMDSVVLPNYVNTSEVKADFQEGDTLSCPGGWIQFFNTSNSLYLTEWDFGDGNRVVENHPVYSYANTGIYTVKLKVTDLNGCTDSIVKPQLIRVDLPQASFSLSDSISFCTPFEVNFTNTSYFWRSLEWDLGQGTSTLTDPTQYYINPGTYTVNLVSISPGGCRDTATKQIVVYDTTGSRITYIPLNGCKPLNVDLTATSPGLMKYVWDYGDGTLVNNDTTRTSHVYNFFGEFVPKVIMIDPSGCVIPVTGLDTIRIKGATTNFGWDKDLFCDFASVRFTDSTTFNDSIMVYEWDFGDGTTSNLQHPVHQYNSPGLYSVSLNVKTLNGCADTLRIPNTIRVVQSPAVRVDGDSVICVNEFMKHLGVMERPDTSQLRWSWLFPNGNSSALQLPDDQKYGTAGNFVVSTVAMNSSGCTDTATKNILVNPLPVVTVPATITKQAGFPVQITGTYTSNVNRWNWTPVTGLDCTNCPQPVTSTRFNTRYSVAVVDSNGCRNTGQVQIIVLCKNSNVFVPNTFSPNGDGSNDVFYVRGKGLERVKSLRIFNRWGEIVFEQRDFPVNNSAYGWDGKYKGNKPQADVYVYQVEVWCENSEVIRFEGNVALIQ